MGKGNAPEGKKAGGMFIYLSYIVLSGGRYTMKVSCCINSDLLT